MVETLSAAVGRGRTTSGGNRPADVEKVKAALAAIDPASGGAAGAATAGLDALFGFIEAFQRRWWPGTAPDGWISPGGRTWQKIQALLNPGAAAASAGASGPKTFKVTGASQMYQGDPQWSRQQINDTTGPSSNIWTYGCLLTSISCAFNWKGVKVPPSDLGAVTTMLKAKQDTMPDAYRKFAYSGPRDVINPATLDAWGTINSSQGYTSPGALDLNAGKMSRITTRKDLTFWGRHDPSMTNYLKMPDEAQMAAWVNAEWILIVRRTANQHHYLWVTGYDGAGNFSVWDVGYSAGNENHTSSVRAEDLDRVFRWGPTR